MDNVDVNAIIDLFDRLVLFMQMILPALRICVHMVLLDMIDVHECVLGILYVVVK